MDLDDSSWGLGAIQSTTQRLDHRLHDLSGLQPNPVGAATGSSQGGNWVATNDAKGRVVVRKSGSGDVTTTINLQTGARTDPKLAIHSIAITTDSSHIIAFFRNEQLYYCRLPDGDVVRAESCRDGEFSASFSPNSEFAVLHNRYPDSSELIRVSDQSRIGTILRSRISSSGDCTRFLALCGPDQEMLSMYSSDASKILTMSMPPDPRATNGQVRFSRSSGAQS